MGITFHTYEEIYTGSTLYFVIPAPSELVPVNVRGVLRWINQKRDDLIEFLIESYVEFVPRPCERGRFGWSTFKPVKLGHFFAGANNPILFRAPPNAIGLLEPVQ